MNLFDEHYNPEKERYKLNPKSRKTARIILIVLLLVAIATMVRAIIKLS
jgi:hypothetical protein